MQGDKKIQEMVREVPELKVLVRAVMSGGKRARKIAQVPEDEDPSSRQAEKKPRLNIPVENDLTCEEETISSVEDVVAAAADIATLTASVTCKDRPVLHDDELGKLPYQLVANISLATLNTVASYDFEKAVTVLFFL